jgi:hypothetical protein
LGIPVIVQTSDQLIEWAITELPSLKARLQATHAAIARARDSLSKAADCCCKAIDDPAMGGS